MSKRAKVKEKKSTGRYGGVLPPTVKSLARAYVADYERRKRIIERGSALERDEPRFKKVNAIIDSVIASVFDMHGISGEAADILARDIKSCGGSRSARSVSGVDSFLSRYLFEQIKEDVLWFIARELHLF